MPEDISKRPELLIISDTTVHIDDQGRYLAFEPVVREIEYFAHLFRSITWIAFNYPLSKYARNVREISKVDIKYVLIPAVGGNGVHNKLKIIRTYFRLIFLIPKYLRRADVIHTRGPSHPALITAFYSIFFFRDKIFWHKYAGNWIRQKDPFSYSTNKYLLKQARRTTVTINGKWPGQQAHILSFENPCITRQERINGSVALGAKSFEKKLDFVFVGQMVETKGVRKIIETFRQLGNDPRIGLLHFVGDGPARAEYENLAIAFGLGCRFYGFLSREDVNKVLAQTHIILLPSESEGFPKVIAEGANYGCVPVVTDISCLSQYIHDNINGFIMPSPVTEELVNVVQKVIAMDGSTLANMARNAYTMGEQFTYDHYNKRIQNDILNKEDQGSDA